MEQGDEKHNIAETTVGKFCFIEAEPCDALRELLERCMSKRRRRGVRGEENKYFSMNLEQFNSSSSAETNHTIVAEPCENSLNVVSNRGKGKEKQQISYESSLHTNINCILSGLLNSRTSNTRLATNRPHEFQGTEQRRAARSQVA